MAYDVGALRAFGSDRVALETAEAAYTGRIVQEKLGDEPVMLLFACDGDPSPDVVVAIEAIVRIAPV